jgi:hypothetical protein
MLPLNRNVDPEAERRRALGRIYELLLRLADANEADPQPIETKEKESQNETTE